MRILPKLNLLPEHITILHKKFAIKERSPNDFLTDNKLAEINFLKSEISYLPLPGSETADSILHEALHGIWRMMDLEMPDEEEHIVTALATGMVTVMKDNPTLMAQLQQMIGK